MPALACTKALIVAMRVSAWTSDTLNWTLTVSLPTYATASR